MLMGDKNRVIVVYGGGKGSYISGLGRINEVADEKNTKL